jgi:antitoxin ParD1/3/4
MIKAIGHHLNTVLIGFNPIHCYAVETEGPPIMRTTKQFSITLPNDMAAAVEAKINSGAYASVSEVMRDGMRALMERDAAVEKWLRDEVIPGHQEYLADPSKGVPADQILNGIKARRKADTGAGLLELSRQLFGADSGIELQLSARAGDRYVPDFAGDD